MKKSQRQIRKEYKEKGIKTGKERYNIGVTILLILGLVTVLFPLYMTVMIAFKQPSEMTNDIQGILSLPQHWSLSNFKEAMEVTDFWHSLGNSLLITGVTVVLCILIHSLAGYLIGRKTNLYQGLWKVFEKINQRVGLERRSVKYKGKLSEIKG